MKVIILSICLFFFASSNAQKTAPDQLKSRSKELPVTSLEKAGFQRDSIENLLNTIYKTPHKDFRGLVVIKDNHIVIEEYFNTFWRKTIHDIRSAGKSVTSLLLGIAIKEGLIKNLDQTVYALFSKNKYYSVNEDYKKIKLKHVLDMSSGLDADTDKPKTAGHVGKWITKDDWKEYLLNVPLKSQPGKEWVYADINALLIGFAIEEASGMSLKDYAQKKLFNPLGIEQVYWYTNASNQTGAAGNLYLSTLDFAKLGLLVVNEGKWNNIQIIDPNFIKELITHKNFNISEYFSLADSYGMFWYKTSRTFGNKNIDYLFASGNGGNHLVVVPKENMIIALTSSAYGPGYGQRRSYTIMSKILNALD
ncbi:serine hydrolase domain-containing protein [Aquimarina celericrescens]|uniref:Serine hydrolase domain-containing protein n=1 Tax=Aquimarina celericrescens TaxID=1964542 RepID=A0ABW5AS40_9FLAO|nr:serine hydrolase [Aquimarina celericrescens]